MKRTFHSCSEPGTSRHVCDAKRSSAFSGSFCSPKLSPARWDIRSVSVAFTASEKTEKRIKTHGFVAGCDKAALFQPEPVPAVSESALQFRSTAEGHALFSHGDAFSSINGIRSSGSANVEKWKTAFPCAFFSGLIRRRQLPWEVTIPVFYFFSIGKKILLEANSESQR